LTATPEFPNDENGQVLRRMSMWEVIVKRHMIPQHATIRAMESMLTLKAENLGGKPDGWGCMQTKMR